MVMSVSANVLFCSQPKAIEFNVSSEERKQDIIHIQVAGIREFLTFFLSLNKLWIKS